MIHDIVVTLSFLTILVAGAAVRRQRLIHPEVTALAMKQASLALTLLVVAVGIACGADSYQIAIVPRDTVHGFWKSVHAGAKKAQRELAAQNIALNIIWQGPERENDVAGQVQSMGQFMDRPVDGIILAPLDRKELSEPVANAVRRKIPVVVINSGLDSKAPVTLVASDNYEAGRIAARRLAELIGGKGNVILFRHHIHSANTEEREEGFLAVMSNEFPGIKLLATDYHAGPTRSVAKRVGALLIGKHRAKLAGICASSECAASGVLLALRNSGIGGGKVKVIGFEDEGGTLRAALAAGDVQGMVKQNPEAMGYHAVKVMVAALRGEQAPRLIETGISFVTKDEPNGSNITARTVIERGSEIERTPKVVAADRDDFVVPELGLVMVQVQPGTFEMAATRVEPPVAGAETAPLSVTLSRGFWLGKVEVTQREWRVIMGDNPSDFTGEQLPMDNVSWNDAMNFCRKLNERERAAGRLPKGYTYTLPTEAQWEYACRAGETETAAVSLDDMAWHARNSGSWSAPSGPLSRTNRHEWRMTTHPVGQKQANAWGLYDMLGNVAEWCLDGHSTYLGSSVVNPSAPSVGDYHVLRGGSWWTDPQNCTASHRAKAPSARHHSALGFRLALVPLRDAAPETTK